MSRKSLAIVGVYWNPFGFEFLKANFDRWLSCLPKDPDIEVWIAEVIGTDQNPTLPAADKTVIFRSDDVICCIESVRNSLIIQHVKDVDAVLCLDADIIHQDSDWWKTLLSRLERYPIVQGFENASWLGRAGEVVQKKRSLMWGYYHNQLGNWPRSAAELHTGFSWAARRDLWDQVLPGMPDWACLGSNDRALALACTGERNPDWNDWWAQRLTDYTMQLKTWLGSDTPGYCPLDITHLWHGDEKNRLYLERRKRQQHVDWPRHCHYQPNGVLGWTDQGKFLHEGWLRKLWMNRES